ncbi:MAG: pyridoxal-phosphate dependent enzyme, partial [Anaerolineales bacterium]
MAQDIPNISQNNVGDKSLAARIPQAKGYRCTVCNDVIGLDEARYICSACGQVGTLDVVLDTSVIWPGRQNPQQPKANVWEEERFLPIAQDMPPPAQTIPLQVGGTPYYPSNERHPYAIIDDGKNPTGSFKDRASAMVVHQALTIGAPVVATASTGNAAAALAGICAAVGSIQAVIFVPASAPQAKIAQLLVYGAEVILVDGPYDDAFDLCWEACARYGWYNRSTGINP